ncbi:interactor of HORMAD1 protein 1 [Scomber scombrus]|uniref:Interactor of HORMAD1 protein 1 n=1 Tax=Scomber scombrus TaxID=13677 RepID=A0AAV1PR72_SCOSC
MNHARNIKEMLSFPTGSRWLANSNAATSGYSSCTDSQFFLGSQFWPENSQGASQDMSLSSRASQQSSQEGSDPKFASSYHTKPLMFGELKDKTKAFGLLDKFEEDKKKAKEKTDSDILAKECLNIQETLNNIQQLVIGTEKNTAVCQTVLETFNNFASTLQNNLNSLQSDISQQFETLLNKVNSQKEVMTGLEERVQKGGDTTVELGSNVQSFKTNLQCLREEQERERSMLDEALKLLSTLVSEHSSKHSPGKVMDSASQTSPCQDNKLEGTQLTSSNVKCNLVEVPPRDFSRIIGKRKSTSRGIRRGHKKRPLVLSERSKHSVSDENSQPVMKCHKQQNVSEPLCGHRDLNKVTSRDSLKPDFQMPLNRETRSTEAAGCFITPLSCWSQDSNSSACLPAAEPILEKLSAEMPAKPESFWQLFDMNCDSDLGF